MILTKQQILERRLKVANVDLPDGGQISVRAVPLHVVERAQKVDAPDFGADAYVFVNAVVDSNGKRLYSDEEAALVADSVDAGLMQLVVSKAYALASLDAHTRDAIKKNWTTLRGESSGASPSPSDIPIQT